MRAVRNEVHVSEPTLATTVAAVSRTLGGAINAVVSAARRRETQGVARVRHLITAEAPLDAALACVDVEAPEWKLRRLVYEDGEWLCSLSRQINLPLEIDDCVEARHAIAAQAILEALVEAKQVDNRAAEGGRRKSAVPEIRSHVEVAVPCENYR